MPLRGVQVTCGELTLAPVQCIEGPPARYPAIMVTEELTNV